MNKKEIHIEKQGFPSEAIKRLSLYLRNLKKLREKNIELISSAEITQFLNVTPCQFRKDLSYFGGFGKRGVGYNVGKLIVELDNILGTNKEWKIALIGVGRLGSALLSFEGFSEFNIKIASAFDVDEEKIGRTLNGIEVENIKDLERNINKRKIKMAIICTPPEITQKLADRLTEIGVRGILNFAPIALKTSRDTFVSNVDMACELERLIFFLKGVEDGQK
ncbi:MAG: redox-sensing transcriptional repressor Rex [Candidatus Omnitrophica bacterium]|nr:redox-sensing transcriptional repressor Rex [Candidatus Omnitrophota bacterium]